MKSLINIEIKDSFNKKGNFQKSTEDVSNNSTLNSSKNIAEISSMSLGSITGDVAQVQENFKIVKNEKKNRHGFWRQVLIGIISGVIGIVLGAFINYFIFGIK